MANTMVSFKRGSDLSKLAIADGQFIVNTAERSIYVDIGTERLRIGDFVSVANLAALPTAGANETALYYVEDINCLAKWNGTGWTQINRDSGAVNFTVTGVGNAITSVAYDADTRTLTLTKGITFATPADVDNKISEKVGELKIGEDSYDTVKAYVDKKTSGIATDESLSALTERVDTLEGKVDVESVSGSITAAKTAVLGQADYTGTVKGAYEAAQAAQDTADSKATMKEVEAKGYATKTEAQGYANAKDTAIAEAKAAGDNAQSAVDALSTKVGTVAEGKTVVKMIEEAQAEATYDDTALVGRVSAIEGDYLKAADKTALQNAINAEVATARAAEEANATAIAGVKEDVDAFFASAEVGEVAIDTLKEIQNYINTHGEAAATMTQNIADNAKAISDEITRAKAAEKANADAITAQATSDAETYETKTDASAKLTEAKGYADNLNTAMDERVDALETASHTHSNKALLDTYTQTEANLADAVAKMHDHANAEELAKIETGDKEKWDTVVADHLVAADKAELEGKITAAETAAKNHANDLNTAMNTRVEALEAIEHDHSNKTVLDGITSEKVDTWDSAEQNAKNYSDAKLLEALEWGTF